jgi:hypothetical protein
VGGLTLRDGNLLHLVRNAAVALKIPVYDLPRFQSIPPATRQFPLFRINRKQFWWNKRESDAVWKSVKDLKQRSEQHIDTAPAIDLGDTEISSIVSAGGGKYVGVLKEIPNKMESVVLFNSPRTRTTLGIRISSLTVDAVRKHLAESDAAFAEAGAK